MRPSVCRRSPRSRGGIRKLTLIIDHMGFARETSDDNAAAGADRVLALAKLPNVSVKVSALPCYSSEPYPFRNLHDPLKRIIEGFGIRRAFWGSDLSRMLRALHLSAGGDDVHRRAGLSFGARSRMDHGTGNFGAASLGVTP